MPEVLYLLISKLSDYNENELQVTECAMTRYSYMKMNEKFQIGFPNKQGTLVR